MRNKEKQIEQYKTIKTWRYIARRMNSNLCEYMQWLQICLYYNSKDHIERETVGRLLEQLAVVVLHSDFMLSILSLTLVANMEVVTVATSSIDLWHNAGIEATTDDDDDGNSQCDTICQWTPKKEGEEEAGGGGGKWDKAKQIRGCSTSPIQRDAHATQIDENKSRNTK